MENTHRKKLGINCKKRNGVIIVGVHFDTFIETFKERVNDKGWVNFGMLENDDQQGEYSHKPILLSGQ